MSLLWHNWVGWKWTLPDVLFRQFPLEWWNLHCWQAEGHNKHRRPSLVSHTLSSAYIQTHLKHLHYKAVVECLTDHRKKTVKMRESNYYDNRLVFFLWCVSGEAGGFIFRPRQFRFFIYDQWQKCQSQVKQQAELWTDAQGTCACLKHAVRLYLKRAVD